MPRKALVTLAVLTLALSGCSASPTPSNPPVASEQASAQPTEEHQSPGHTLPVASIFGEPAWNMQIPPSWEQMTPVVTAQRVIALDDATVRAYDQQGCPPARE